MRKQGHNLDSIDLRAAAAHRRHRGKIAVMIIEAGHIALCLALRWHWSVASIGLVRRDAGAALRLANASAVTGFVLTGLSFAALTWAYIASDFSVLNVVSNSHSLKPMIYKISGVWGNHEGSLLLWVLILALFGALVALFHGDMASDLKAAVLSMQGLVAVAFLLRPLHLQPVRACRAAAFRGARPQSAAAGYRPRHPSAAALCRLCRLLDRLFLCRRCAHPWPIDAVWARAARPWVLLAWIFLTLGIAMGSYWAYYELAGRLVVLGSGRECLLHALACGHGAASFVIVMEKRDALKIWTVLLAILAFSLSLLGTFVVRSAFSPRSTLRDRSRARCLYPRHSRVLSSAAASRFSRGARRN